jgi:hypothetical protein
VAQRGGPNERQLEHLGTEIGQGRHAEAGRQRTGDHRKAAERVGADFPPIALDIDARVVEIGVGQASDLVQLAREVSAQAQRRGAARSASSSRERSTGRPSGRCRLPDGRTRSWRGSDRRRPPVLSSSSKPAGDQRALVAGDAQANAVGEQSRWLWIPAAAGGQKTAFDSRHRRQSPSTWRWSRRADREPAACPGIRCAASHRPLADVPPGAQIALLPGRPERDRLPVDRRLLDVQRLVQREAKVLARRGSPWRPRRAGEWPDRE